MRNLVGPSPAGRSRHPLLLVALGLAVLSAVVLVFAFAASGSGSQAQGITMQGAEPGAEAAGTATPVPEAEPAAHAELDDPGAPFEPLTLALRPEPVGDGETLLFRAEAPGAVRGTLEVLGRLYPLVREGDVLWAVIGIPLETPVGTHGFVLTTYAADGTELERVENEFEVIEIERPIDYVYLTPDQTSVLTPEASAHEAQLRVEQFVVFDRERQWDEPWLIPAEGWLTTPFGEGRSYNDGPVSSYHLGLDIGNDQGTPIIAPAPGRVAWVGEMPMRGLSVLVDHGAGVVSGYHHLVEWSVEVGDPVETGDQLGLMGSTGLSTGPHLHWEISIYGVNVDPDTWMRADFTP